MRFASVIHQGRERAVMVDGAMAIPLIGARELGPSTPTPSLLAPRLDQGSAFPIAEATLRPVVPNPSKIICLGLNYVEHIEETGNKRSDYPVFFPKFASSLIGPYAEIPLPPEDQAVDYEGELAVVIGAPARRVPREQALGKVAGYTVANDVSMRTFQYKSGQYMAGKAWDKSTPLGPYLVTPDELGDPQDLALRTLVNGQLVQQSSTSLQIFDVATFISTVSEFLALMPGDVLLTGTPSGVGFRRQPPLLLRDGDTVVVEIEGVGRLENRAVTEVVA